MWQYVAAGRGRGGVGGIWVTEPVISGIVGWKKSAGMLIPTIDRCRNSDNARPDCAHVGRIESQLHGLRSFRLLLVHPERSATFAKTPPPPANQWNDKSLLAGWWTTSLLSASISQGGLLSSSRWSRSIDYPATWKMINFWRVIL